jgi:ankyrin repeat protein
MTYDEAYRAIKHGRTDILAEAIPSTLDPNAANRFGWTLLMAAAHEGNTTIGRLLLDRGADVAPLNDFGESALSLAAHKSHLPFVKLLKARGASADVRPHGLELSEWLRISSGLSQVKIDAVLAAALGPG